MKKPSKTIVESPRKGSAKPELSVIVCSFNGAERIGDCIDALVRQTAANRLEIIVVDDGSPDATTFIASDVLERSSVRHKIITFPANQGLSAARNAGVQAAKAPIVAFTDDDCVPGGSWAEMLLSAWSEADDQVHGIGGPVEAHSSNTYNRRFLQASEPLRVVEQGDMRLTPAKRIKSYLSPRRVEGRRFVDSFVGANMSFRRKTVVEVGGFNDNIRFGGDEQYICRQIVDAYGPESLACEPSLIIHHEFHPSVRDTLRRAHAYGMGNGRKWLSDGGIPSVLPGPAMIIAATLCSVLVSFAAAVVTFATLTFLLGRAPLRTALRGNGTPRILEALTYPFVATISEVADNVGFLRAASSNIRHKIAVRGWLWLAAACSVGSVDLGWPGKAVAIATMILLPGSAILARVGYRPRDFAARLASATGVGLTLSMAVGLATSWFGPRVGFDRPLDQVPATITAVLVGSVLLIAAGRQNDPYTWLAGTQQRPAAGWFIGLAALPAVSALCAMRLNNGGSGTPAYILTALLMVLTLVTMFVAWSEDRGWPVEFIVASVSLALAWSSTLRGHGLFGWDIQKELGIGQWTVENGAWAIPSNGDAYASMLSLTVLPAQFQSIVGLSVESSLRWVYPIFLAITAAGVLAAARRFANPGPALLALLLTVVGTPSFARQIPAIGRQEVAFLLVACILLAVTDRQVPLRARQALAIIAGIGLGYSHYTTAYVTSFFLIVVLVVAPFLGRGGAPRVLGAKVCLIIIASTILWNGVLTRPGTELTEAQATLTNTGVRFLDNDENNPLRTWLGGTSVVRASFEDYRSAVVERRDRIGWVVPDPRADTVQLRDDDAPVVSGALPQLKGAWYLGSALLRQIVILLTAISLFWYLRRILAKRPEFNVDLFALGLGAFLVAAVLRVSSTAAELYNPERAAIHAGLVFTLILAAFFSSHAKRISLPSAMAVLLVFGAWGLASPVFGGAQLASLSHRGEDVERYVTTSADSGTAAWIGSALPYSANVHTDRYGRVVLLSREQGDKFTTIDVVDPVGVDRDGYIFFTSMNRNTGRVRGQIGDRFSVFSSPERFFTETRDVVYATEETRVYR